MKKLISVLTIFISIVLTIIPTFAAVYPSSGGMQSSLPYYDSDSWTVDNYGTMVTGQVYFYDSSGWHYTQGTDYGYFRVSPSFIIPNQLSRPWDDTQNGDTIIYDACNSISTSIQQSNAPSISYTCNPYVTNTNAVTNIAALFYPTNESYNTSGAMFIGQFAGFRDIDDTGEYCDGLGIGLHDNSNGFNLHIRGTYYYYHEDTGETGELYVDQTASTLAGANTYFPPHYFSLDLNANDYTNYVFDGIVYWNWTNSTYPGVYVHYSKDFGVRADVVDGDFDDHYYYGDMLFGDNCIMSYMYAYSMLKNASSGGNGTKYVTVQANGSYTYDVSDYEEIQVTVDVVGGGDPPTPGNVLTIEENGFFDVTQYNYVDVDVPQEIIEQELPSNMFSWLLNVASEFLKFEIAPNFTIGGIMILCVGFALIMWLLKVFLGG